MKDIFAYAEELERMGRTQAVLAEYGDLLDANLGGIEPLFRRSAMLRDLGLFAEAREDLQRAADMEPRNGWPLLRLAQMAHAVDKPWLAAAYVQAAMDRQPEAPEMRVNAAAIFSSLDWLDRAFDVVRLLPWDLTDWWGEMRRSAETTYRQERRSTLEKLRARRRTGEKAAAPCW